MAYYDERRSYAPPRNDRGYATEYYEEHPRAGYARYEREVRPHRGSQDSVEEIQRDYPPGSEYVYERGYDARRPARPTYENVRRASSVGGGYDPYAGDGYYHRTRRTKYYDDHHSRRSRYASTSSSSPSPPPRRRRKSFGETALGALGLESVVSKSSDRTDRRRGRSSSRYRGRGRGRDYSSSPSRSRSRSRRRRDGRDRAKSQDKMMQAARAALTAGAVEAFKSRKDPGPWTGAKGKRILTAAITAAGTDGLLDKDPKKHSNLHVIESTIAGLAAGHLVGGPKGRDGRGRSRSGGGLKDLAATGALAAAGKEIFDRVSRSRSRRRDREDRGRSHSRDSGDDERRGSKKRSKSVSDYINKGMAALGLGEEASEHDRRDRSRERDDGHDRRRERRRHRDRDSRYDSYSDSDADTDYRSRDYRRGRGSRDVGRYRSANGSRAPPPRSAGASRGERGPGSSTRRSSSSSESSSDLGDSDNERKQSKKMKRDLLLTSGLATVATIHAAHSAYTSVEKRKKRMEQVKAGEITADEARKRRMKANTVDAVSIGLAALGIKGAYSEWKEANEKRKETRHFQEECAERRIKREMRRSRSQGHGAYHRRRWPDEIEYPTDAHSTRGTGVAYHDGNPYAATAAPAIAN
ncbi:hypothetical protein N7539_004217 [Penicillium diatomitis]|uniref:DUF3824 domain-containing protein n=1 Tax=Penicillium diatomitis TaxID=2819901 RepID=A0A9X0BYL2_9EURO|nr:uncharacterized protein N7539_004217 [Penicillium diatomitis]KAJ5489327.1 hypothetical protein N7539_004217 [Penicillium diatomitis]